MGGGQHEYDEGRCRKSGSDETTTWKSGLQLQALEDEESIHGDWEAAVDGDEAEAEQTEEPTKTTGIHVDPCVGSLSRN